MPSFLNKVFGYKKHDDKEAARPAADSALLDGKYEAIAPVLSPSATTFAEAQQASDRDGGFSLFRPKIRGISQKSPQKRPENVPHLTLQLPGPKENRTLSVVFEADPDSQILLDDAVIAAKRLSPLEALILIRACTQAITERGLETLGIMHPHWLSASPDVQRRLISLFIRSLTQSQITTLSPTPASSTSAFENELHYTRSPHDVAAVLRWGLRHLSLENDHFGKDGTEMGWYNTFFQAERNASYPVKGFSELLVPQLPASHLELLTVTLTLISALASHAEANSISGSKLSKFLGLWLLVATRAEESDDWNRFYARWENSGRVLEHLFLARLREESLMQRLPTRLQELVKHYPYNKGSPAADNGLLSRPRFSTRQYDALFVRVETLLSNGSEQPKQHPIQLLLEAFQLPIDDFAGNEHVALWNILKTTAFEGAALSDSQGPQFARIFVDETIHLLSLIPAGNNFPTSPAFLTSPVINVVSRKRSSSPIKTSKSNTHNGSTPISSLSPTSPSSIAITDWSQFALSGFGHNPTTQPLSTPLSPDDDIEVTQPQISRKSSRRGGKSRSRRRGSEDHEPLDNPPSSQSHPDPSIIETRLASVHVVQIDEAFIDFWSDAIIDPISANWPTFVVCALKQIPSAENHKIRWLVIEQTYARQELQPSRVPSPDGRRGRSPRPSFKSDISGFRINSVFSSARKRFSVFSKSATDLELKKSGGKTPVAGELGEILVEEEPALPSTPLTKTGLHADGNGTVATTVTSGATADVCDHLMVGEISNVSILAVPPAPALKESEPVQGAVKVPLAEPLSLQSAGGYNGSSLPPHASARASEETISVERDSPRGLDAVHSQVDIISPLMTDTPHPQSTQDTCDPKVPSGSAFPVENLVIEEVHIQSEKGQQDVAIGVEDRDDIQTGSMLVQSDAHVDVTDNGSREVVAIPPTPETVALVAAAPLALAIVTAVDLETPSSTVEEPTVATQDASADPVAALTVESVGRHEIDDLAPLSSTEVIATETGAQLEPHSIPCVVDEEALEITEDAEIPTPAPELVALVEETPGQEASVDLCGPSGDVGNPTAQPEVLNDTVPQPVVLEDAAFQPVAAELQPFQADESFVTRPVETPCVEVIDTPAQVVAEPTSGQLPEVPLGETQDNVTQTAEVPSVEVLPVPPATSDASTGIVSALQTEDVAPTEVEAQAAPANFVHEDLIETQGTATPSPLLEDAASVNETPEHLVPTDAQAAPAITITPGVDVETKVQDTVVEPEATPVVSTPLAEEAEVSSGAELPAQVRSEQAAAEPLSPEADLEAPNAALATQDEVIVGKSEGQTIPDVPTQDAEAQPRIPESAPVEEALEIAVEASGPTPDIASEPEIVEPKAPEPVAEEPQVLVDEVPNASEPVTIAPVVPVEEPVVAQDAPVAEPSDALVPQFVDEAANPSPTLVAVPVPEEIVSVQVEASSQPEVATPTVDTVDEPLVEDAEPLSVVPEQSVLDAETHGLGAGVPETPAAEPEPTEASVTALVVIEEDVDMVDEPFIEDAEPVIVDAPETPAIEPEPAEIGVTVPALVAVEDVDVDDETFVEDAEPGSVAPKHSAPIMDAPETPATEPEPTEISVIVPVVVEEDVDTVDEPFIEDAEPEIADAPETPAIEPEPAEISITVPALVVVEDVDTADETFVEDAEPGSVAPIHSLPIMDAPETSATEPEPTETSVTIPVVVEEDVDSVDEILVEDAEPAPAAAEHIVPIVGASAPETLAAEPEPAEVSMTAPVIVEEDMPAAVEAEASFVPVAIGASESEPEIDETAEVDQPGEVDDRAKPATSEPSISAHVSTSSSEETATTES